MKPFLHLATRDLDAAAADEYAAILQASGLLADQLVHVRVDAGPMQQIDPQDYSGVFIGGSSFNTSDAHKSPTQVQAERDLGWFVDQAANGALPLLGLCYGIGVAVQHRGGRMDTTFGESTSAVPVTLTDAGREDPVFAQLPDRFTVCTGHKEACAELPADTAVLLRGDHCPVQAIRVGEACYATQFHAELNAEQTVDRMRLYRHTGYFPADEFDAVATRVRAGGVEQWAAQIVRRFAEQFTRL